MEKSLYFLYTSIAILSLPGLSIAVDTLGPAQSIIDGESLVSSGKNFGLGFFSHGNSNYRYLGVWFKMSPQTVVWVANRNNPLTDSNGPLEISGEAELVLLNQSKSVLGWTNSSRVLGSPVAQLLDSGNLVLTESKSLDSANYSWQSFDYPSYTLLVGVKVEWDFKAGLEHNLTSWKSADDPSPGDFTFRNTNEGLPQLEIVCKDSVKVYQAGPWNGVHFSSVSLEANIVVKPIFVYNETSAYFAFESLEDDITVKVTLSQSGLLQCLLRRKGSTKWEVMYSLPDDPCERYGQCGPNAVCGIYKIPRCQCLRGFMPKSQEEWDTLNSTEGCIRRTLLNCSRGEGFMKLPQVKLPDLIDSQLSENMRLKECKAECLKNCSCTAYANSNVRGAGCLLWFGDLIVIKEVEFFYSQQEVEEINKKQNLYIRVTASKLGTFLS